VTTEEEIAKLRALLAEAAEYVEAAANVIADDLDYEEDDDVDAREFANKCRKAAKGDWS